MTNDLIEQLLSDAEAFTGDFNSVAFPGPLANKRAERLRQAAAHIEALAERVRELEGVYIAARHYYAGWMQDEASEDYKAWVSCSDKQHQAAAAVRDALERARQARKDKENG
jgi:hypothetical protein